MGMIDREKVIKAYECCKNSFDRICEKCPYEKDCCHDGIPMFVIKKMVKLLEEQEAVARKTGHWIYLQDCANEGVYCSECHTKMFDRYPMKKKLSQFCAHCGAKMDEEVEGR